MSLKEYYDKRLARKIKEYPNIKVWDLIDSEDLTLDTLIEFPDLNWDWKNLNLSNNFSFEWVRKFPNKPWNWNDLDISNDFSFAWVEEFPDKNWDWGNMHEDIDFSWDWVKKFPTKPWDWTILSTLTRIEILSEFPMWPWDWESVTVFSKIPVEDICKNPNFPWTHNTLSFDSVGEEEIVYLRQFVNILQQASWVDYTRIASWSIIKRNMELPWAFYYIRDWTSFEDSDVDTIKNIGINWCSLSKQCPMDIVVNHLNLPWCEKTLSINQTLKTEHFKHFKSLDHNFTPCDSKEDVVRKWHAAGVIKRAWKQSLYNPNYKNCKRYIQQFIIDFQESILNPSPRDT
jgi:hypothetical protein